MRSRRRAADEERGQQDVRAQVGAVESHLWVLYRWRTRAGQRYDGSNALCEVRRGDEARGTARSRPGESLNSHEVRDGSKRLNQQGAERSAKARSREEGRRRGAPLGRRTAPTSSRLQMLVPAERGQLSGPSLPSYRDLSWWRKSGDDPVA